MQSSSKLYYAQIESKNKYFVDLVYSVCFWGKFPQLTILKLDHGHGAFFEIQDQEGNYYGSGDLDAEKEIFDAVDQYNRLVN